ncbi:hypothetical protein PYW07_000605 [Mythimna separata]|uniref:Uncharacterized protein n=1 Tax=Mythimna separata TaxID=271217 RepID=A0AAD8E159_MYTSE|nr:hypothetical protein PYW07_001831 [Mythimna separata]KAJ8737334.1 hypothetical protein PYW07_000605 [Mythimna separata]
MQSCKPYFIKYKMLTITSIYIMEVSKFVRKHALLFPVAKNQRPLQRSLRVKNELALPSSKLAMFQSGPLVMCIKIYNKLPNEIKDIEFDNKFVNALKLYLIQKCYYSLNEFLTN